jgi:O-antigen/teichoic acid export membrane protein
MRGASVGMRVGAAAAKLALTIVVTAYMGVESAGEFALFLTSATLLGQLIGVDFFTFAMREMASRSSVDAIKSIVAGERVLFTWTYLAGIALAVVPFAANFIAWEYLPVFIAISLLEQVSQELYRVLVSVRRPVLANFIYFVRGALWVLPLVVLLAIQPSLRSLHMVYAAWLIGVTLSVVVAAMHLRRLLPGFLQLTRPESGVIRDGLRVAMPYFAGSLLLNVVEYADRYFIGATLGTSDVGVYWLYRGITNLVPVAAYFAVYEFGFPDLASSFRAAEGQAFVRNARALLMHGVGVTATGAIGAAVLAPALLGLLGQPVLTAHLPTLYILIGAAVLVSVSNAFTFIVNAMRSDRVVLAATGLACAVSLIGNAVFIQRFGLPAAAVVFGLASAVRAIILGAASMRGIRRIRITARSADPVSIPTSVEVGTP